MINVKYYITLPQSPGVYLFYDNNQHLLYIGKAKNLKKRVSSYFTKHDTDLKLNAIISKIAFIDYRITTSEQEALLVEQNLINHNSPKYNINLKDDKSYTMLALSKDDYPRLSIVRQKDDPAKALLFGPYTTRAITKNLYDFVLKQFQLCVCKKSFTKKSKPCFNYHIGKCCAPCAFDISKEDYDIRVKKTISFLKGEYSFLLKSIKEEINKKSSSMHYEDANKLKIQYDLIKDFNKKFTYSYDKLGTTDFVAVYIRDNQGILTFFRNKDGKKIISFNKLFKIFDSFRDSFHSIIIKLYETIDIPDRIYIPSLLLVEDISLVFATVFKKNVEVLFYRNKSEMIVFNNLLKQLREVFLQSYKIALFKEIKQLKELQKVLQLTKIPYRIEAFDISNMDSKIIAGASVSFLNGIPDKSNYRYYNIRSVDFQNDVAAIKEIATRRILDYMNRKVDLPDLLLIDGGTPQVNAINSIINESFSLSLPIIGLAKKRETIICANSRKEINLDFSNPALRLITRIRDEAHRFANKLRSIKIQSQFHDTNSAVKGKSK